MEYVELAVSVPLLHAEAAAAVLRQATGAGAAIELGFSQPDLESDARLERDASALVRAWVRPEAADDARAAASDALAGAGIAAEVRRRRVADQDWAEAWKEHFHVERYGRILVVPSWRTAAPRAGDAVITLDPGMAFGTGQHETTRMCLEALDRLVRRGASVLDLGCGSGILALAAARLGAASVRALDIDPDCVRITRDNAEANALDSVVRAGAIAPDGPLPEGPFDVVVANIVAAVIVARAPALVAALAREGALVVSGVIAAREQEVREALVAAGARISRVRAMGEWRCIEARHRR